MAKAVKLADIAERVGVSTVTVSKALSGQKGVSEEVREKIHSIAEELGYQQPSAARKSQNPGADCRGDRTGDLPVPDSGAGGD